MQTVIELSSFKRKAEKLFNPIYLLACYGKNEKGDLTSDEKKAVTAFALATKVAARKKKK